MQNTVCFSHYKGVGNNFPITEFLNKYLGRLLESSPGEGKQILEAQNLVRKEKGHTLYD